MISNARTRDLPERNAQTGRSRRERDDGTGVRLAAEPMPSDRGGGPPLPGQSRRLESGLVRRSAVRAGRVGGAAGSSGLPVPRSAAHTNGAQSVPAVRTSREARRHPVPGRPGSRGDCEFAGSGFGRSPRHDWPPAGHPRPDAPRGWDRPPRPRPGIQAAGWRGTDSAGMYGSGTGPGRPWPTVYPRATSVVQPSPSVAPREASQQVQHATVRHVGIIQLRGLDDLRDRRQARVRHDPPEGAGPDGPLTDQLVPVPPGT